MEPVIRNYRSVYHPGGAAARLIALDDNPTTCTMTYSVIEPGKTSTHHIHPWEHVDFMLPRMDVVRTGLAGLDHGVRHGTGCGVVVECDQPRRRPTRVIDTPV